MVIRHNLSVKIIAGLKAVWHTVPMHGLSNDCWNRIGAAGDQSCPELRRHVHCRNCPVFAAAAGQLLERGLPDGYAREWAGRLAEPVRSAAAAEDSLTVFHVGAEWLALPSAAFREVAAVQTVRVIPHRSNAVLLGLVSVRGAIHLCFSMAALLGLNPAAAPASDAKRSVIAPRHCLLDDHGRGWVFQADAVLGLCRFHAADLRPPPATVAHALPQFSRGLIDHAGHVVGVLDEARLFKALAGVTA